MYFIFIFLSFFLSFFIYLFIYLFLFYLTLSVSEKLKNLIFEIPIIPQTLNIKKHKCKVNQTEYHYKSYQILFKKRFFVKTMFIPNFFMI